MQGLTFENFVRHLQLDIDAIKDLDGTYLENFQ